MRRTRILKSVVLAWFVFAGWSQARPQTVVKITSIDVPGAVGTEAISLNSAGVVVGQSVDFNGTYHGFLRSLDGAIATVDAPGAGTASGEGTQPWSINAAGEITGWYTDSSGLTHGFLRTANGSFSSIDVPGAAIPAGVPCSPPVICSNGTQPASINATGVIAGQYVDAGGVFHGFLRSLDGTITTFDAPGAGTNPGEGTYIVFVDGISPSGAIVGGYQYASGFFQDFVRAPDGTITEFDPNGSAFPDTAGINAQGETIGWYVGSTGSFHGFWRSLEGEITLFDLSGAGTGAGQGTQPQNLNAGGDFTGDYIDGNGVNHGFLRKKNGTITTFDAPGAGTGAGQGTLPFCNNTSNAIVGTYIDAGGQIHGFLRE